MTISNITFANEKDLVIFKVDNKNVNFLTQFSLGSISNGFSVTESRKATLNENVWFFSQL